MKTMISPFNYRNGLTAVRPGSPPGADEIGEKWKERNGMRVKEDERLVTALRAASLLLYGYGYTDTERAIERFRRSYVKATREIREGEATLND